MNDPKTPLITLLVALACLLSLPAFSQDSRVVLIIDDMGYSQALGLRAINLPGAINYAFLPHTQNAQTLAHRAHQQGKEVLLHLPMSNVRDQDPGPGALTPAMNKNQFLQTLADDLAAVPHVRGVNNHMGSLLTQLRQPMSWLMQALQQRQLYFIDSRTSPLTVAQAQAQQLQLTSGRRHIFLDNQRSTQQIAAQFERLLALAKEQGLAVAIGHPHPETLAFLEQALPTLAARGISLSLASEALLATDPVAVNPSTPYY